METEMKKRVVKFDLEGNGCPLIVDESGLDAVFEEIKTCLYFCEPTRFTLEITEMDEAEFNALPEWDGW